MKFKLAIEDKVCVPVKGKLAGATPGAFKPFAFTVTMQRLDQPTIDAALKSGNTVSDFVAAHVQGWDGQRLVLNEDDTPADFGPEALQELLKLPAMGVWIFQAYMREVGVQEKN